MNGSDNLAKLHPGGPIGWTARHPVVPNLLMILLILGGIVAGFALHQEVYPAFEREEIRVVLPLPGADAEQVNRAVALPLEQALADVDGIDRVEVTARDGRAVADARVADGVDQSEALVGVREAVASLTDLPADAERARIVAGLRQRPIMYLAIYGPSETAALIAAAEQFQRALRDDPAIGEVRIEERIEPAIRIEIPRATLRAHGLTLETLARRVREAAEDRGGGSIETAGGALALTVAARRDSLDDFAAIVVGADADGRLLTLGDIATLRRTAAEDSPDLIFNGQPGVKLNIRHTGEATPAEVSAAVRRVIAEMEARLPESFDIAIARDASESLDARFRLLGINALVGLALVLVLLSAFLEIRLAIWVAVGIPTAFAGALLLLPLTGVTLNMVSLFAFILALGLVVDDAIVAGENIYEYRARGLTPADAAVMGARDIAMPLSFSVLTNMLAFLPLAMVPGWYGAFWVMIPIVVSLAFAVSWLEALFVLPGHLAGVTRRPPARGRGLGAGLAWLQRGLAGGLDVFVRRLYGPVLGVALGWRWTVTAALALVAVLLIAWPVSGRMGFSLFPPVKRDYAVMKVGMPFDASREAMIAMRTRMLDAAERVAAEDGNRGAIRVIEGEVRHRRIDLRAHFAETLPEDFSARAFVARFREVLGPLPSVRWTTFGGGGGPGGGAGFEVTLAHPDSAVLARASEDLVERLEGFAAVGDLTDGIETGERALRFRVTPMGRAMGFTPAEVAAQVRAAFHGIVVLRQVEGGGQLRVRLGLPENERRSEHDVESLILRAPDGTEAPLFAIATIERAQGAPTIERRDGRRIVEIEGRIEDPTARATVLEILGDEILPTLEDAYPDLTTALGGDEEAKAETVSSFPISITLTLVLMYAALAVPFRSWVQPIIVLATIPFGVAGAIAGHLIMDMGLTVVAVFGMIALGGVVINAALVMIDYANKARLAGHDATTAVRLAGERRFRPILLTALTTFGGLAPMIFDDSAAAAFLVPIAVSIGYGIVFATVAVMFLIPCLYLMVEDVRWLMNPGRREEEPPVPAA